MTEINFNTAFTSLSGNAPFPWQSALYERFIDGDFPPSCSLPTGLGKTSVIPIWLIALANAPDRVPRRLAYVVNRRTVVDQTTTEAEKMRNRATAAGLPIPAISTLRGQFADNRAWSADPSKPAIIAGTVDMIGSRLLFSGYGIGFKTRPLHAGFLGQDVLLVHDEAHLEPAFQELIVNIEREQHEREQAEKLPWPRLRVMEMTATSRGNRSLFTLTDEDRAEPEVRKRIEAKKTIHLHENKDEKKLAEEIASLALQHKDSGRAVLVFVRKVDDVEKIVAKLRKEKQEVQQLTGTLRGLERDRMADPRKKDACRIFARFLRPPKPDADDEEQWKIEPQPGTVYLVCTSAGEVGVNISADHLVCDLTTFESMAQRFGRVNRFGICEDTCINVVCPKEFEDNDLDDRRKKTLKLLEQLNGDGSPAALDMLDPNARAAAFAPPPTILPTSEILFDSWALTTIRGKLPGRPMVEPYLHGLSELQLPETHVAWREEVGVVIEDLLDEYEPADLLDDYPLKPHELLRDISSRVFDRLKKLAAPAETPVWLVSDDGTVEVTDLAKLIDRGKERIERKTVLLPPEAGGLKDGMLTDNPDPANDVADDWFEDAEKNVPRRKRLWSDEPKPNAISGMRLVCEIDTKLGAEDEEIASEFNFSDVAERETNKGRYWRWYVRPLSADDDGSKTSRLAVTWDDHTKHVMEYAERIADVLLKDYPDLHQALMLAAKFHDLGKKRVVWQQSIGHRLPKTPKPEDWLAKSGRGMKPLELTSYRHEFGSLVELESNPEFQALTEDQRELVRHLIAVHHGRGRPHFPAEQAFDPERSQAEAEAVARGVPGRFARLQRKYGRWGLAYLESLLRAADIAASVEEAKA